MEAAQRTPAHRPAGLAVAKATPKPSPQTCSRPQPTSDKGQQRQQTRAARHQTMPGGAWLNCQAGTADSARAPAKGHCTRDTPPLLPPHNTPIVPYQQSAMARGRAPSTANGTPRGACRHHFKRELGSKTKRAASAKNGKDHNTAAHTGIPTSPDQPSEAKGRNVTAKL